jgi:uncharacterized protein
MSDAVRADGDPILGSPLEARVLGVLVEKQLTTPDYYPMTLNALVAGCNQKTSRDPVMNADEAAAQEALDALKARGLVIHNVGASRRVVRYGHAMPKVLATDPGTTALLAVLMLRGAQTPGELRIACERLYRFPDLSSVEAYLEQMAGRGLAVRLPRQAGARENRWAQLLNGPVEPGDVTAAPENAREDGASAAALSAEVARLREELAALRDRVDTLERALIDAGRS